MPWLMGAEHVEPLSWTSVLALAIMLLGIAFYRAETLHQKASLNVDGRENVMEGPKASGTDFEGKREDTENGESSKSLPHIRRTRAVSDGHIGNSRSVRGRQTASRWQQGTSGSEERLPNLLTGRGGIIGSEYGGRGEHRTQRRGRRGSVVLDEIFELLYDHTAPLGSGQREEEPLLSSSAP